MPALKETPEEAKRLARAIASDISLYNEEKIRQGIEEDTFFDAIAKEIQEGRTHFVEHVVPELREQGIFERALVDVILARKANIKSRIW